MKKVIPAILVALLMFTTGCSSDDEDNSIKLNKSEYTLNFEKQMQIEATSTANINYSTESEYVAAVSSSGLITGGRVGETVINLNNGFEEKSVKVTIEPLHNLFPEPVSKVKLGASKSEVIKAFGNSYREVSGGLVYLNYYSFYSYVFLIENDKVKSSAVVFDTLKAPDDLAEFLTERYKIFAISGYTAGFINEAGDMLVGFTTSDDLSSILVVYLTRNQTKSARTNTVVSEFEKIIEDAR